MDEEIKQPADVADTSINEAEAPAEEAVEKTAEAQEEVGQTATAPSQGVHGLANDDTQYSAESEEVIAFKAIFPDVTNEAAIGSVVTIHNTILDGLTPAGDGVDGIVETIKSKMAADTSEEVKEAEEEIDGDEEEV